MAKVHVDSVGGSNTSPYDTWAKAAATLNEALAVWAIDDECFIHGGATSPHRETVAADLSIDCAASTAVDWVPVHVVDNNSGSTYDAIIDPTTAAAPLIETTVNNAGIIANCYIHFFGAWIESAENFIIAQTGKGAKYTNCKLEIGTIDDGDMSFAEAVTVELENTEIAFGPTDGGGAESVGFNIGAHGEFRMSGGSFTTNSANSDSVAITLSAAQPNGFPLFLGVDFTGLTVNTTYTHIFDRPNNRDMNVTLVNCRLPDLTLFNGTLQHGQHLRLINTDEDSGNLYRFEDHQGGGDVIVSTTLTRAWSDETEPGITAVPLAYKFTPTAGCKIHTPLRIALPFQILATTGSKIITVELLESYTTALNDDQMWVNAYYLGTLLRTTWDLDQASRIFVETAPAALDAGVGTGSWTGTTTGFVSKKLTTTVTVNRTGYFMAEVFLGAFESGKVAYVCPKIDVS